MRLYGDASPCTVTPCDVLQGQQEIIVVFLSACCPHATAVTRVLEKKKEFTLVTKNSGFRSPHLRLGVDGRQNRSEKRFQTHPCSCRRPLGLISSVTRGQGDAVNSAVTSAAAERSGCSIRTLLSCWKNKDVRADDRRCLARAFYAKTVGHAAVANELNWKPDWR